MYYYIFALSLLLILYCGSGSGGGAPHMDGKCFCIVAVRRTLAHIAMPPNRSFQHFHTYSF